MSRCPPRKRQPTRFRVFPEWAVTGSNRRPPACKAGALPAELTARAVLSVALEAEVGFAGLGAAEPDFVASSVAFGAVA
jgi:hypothetical protein